MTEKSQTLDEALIERYVLNPQGLTGEERTVVEAHLHADPSNLAIAEYLQAFYDELDEVDAGAAERIERLVSKFEEGGADE